MKNLLFNFDKVDKIKLLIYLFIFFFASPRYLFTFPGLSLDPSYILALNFFTQEHYNFGKEIVFTYGPLNFLATKLCLTSFQQYLSIIVNLLATLAFTFLVYPYLYKSFIRRDYLQFGLITVGLSLFTFLSMDFTLSLLVLYYAIAIKFIQKPQYSLLLCLSLFPTLSFFIKLNTGLILQFHFLSLILYSAIINKNFKAIIITLLINGSLILILSNVLNVSIYEYVINSLEIVRGYNETNVLVPKKMDIIFILLSIVLSIIKFLFFLFKNNDKILNKLFIGFTFSLVLYIVFKQALIRADNPHIILYFTYSFFIVLFAMGPDQLEKLPNISRLSLIGLVLVNSSWFSAHDKLFIRISQLVKPPFYQIFTPYNQENINKTQANKSLRTLPQPFLDKIKKSTTDILPWEQTFILYNELNYKPRPVFQTYQAYSFYLDSLNSQFYESKLSPEFLLFSNHTIDTRNPFWEETYTKLAILKNYSIIDSAKFSKDKFPSFYTAEDPAEILLLKRNPNKKKIELINSQKIKFNSEYTIDLLPTNNIVIMNFDFKSSLQGSIRSLIFQSALVEASVLVDGVWSRKFRVFPSIFKHGVIINKSILNTNDSKNFFSSNTNLISNVSKVKFYFTDVSRYFQLPTDYTLNEYKVSE